MEKQRVIIEDPEKVMGKDHLKFSALIDEIFNHKIITHRSLSDCGDQHAYDSLISLACEIGMSVQNK